MIYRRNSHEPKLPKGAPLASLLPSVELLSRSREIVDRTILELGVLTIETVLALSAIDVAGEPERGRRKAGEVRHHGSQKGNVKVGGKRVQIDKPRLRSREGREVQVPAYEVLRSDPKSGDRALTRVLKGISTRDYSGVFDEAGQELGLSKSNVSRSCAKASESALKELCERRIEKRQLAIFIDGVRLGDSVAVAAVGVDENGSKRVLGLSEGATENSASVGALLDSLIDRGLDPEQPALFVLDGAKALTKAVSARFSGLSIQRCQIHKARNVLSHLPEKKRKYFDAALKAAYKLSYAEALERLQELAKELDVLHPGAAASLREGLFETLTVSRLNLPEVLKRSLSSTNIIESSFSRSKSKLARVGNYSSGGMAMRWLATAMMLAESGFRAVRGCKTTWMLKEALDNPLKVEAQ